MEDCSLNSLRSGKDGPYVRCTDKQNGAGGGVSVARYSRVCSEKGEMAVNVIHVIPEYR